MALNEAIRDIKRTNIHPLYESEVENIVSAMSLYERDSVIRLDYFRQLMKHVRKEPWKLLSTPKGDITFEEENFAITTREGLRKKPTTRYITYQQLFQLAEATGTDVRGIIRSFAYRGEQSQILSTEELNRLDGIADQALPNATLEDLHVGHVIRSNQSAVFHGILD